MGLFDKLYETALSRDESDNARIIMLIKQEFQDRFNDVPEPYVATSEFYEHSIDLTAIVDYIRNCRIDNRLNQGRLNWGESKGGYATMRAEYAAYEKVYSEIIMHLEAYQQEIEDWKQAQLKSLLRHNHLRRTRKHLTE
jgi:hypothetical protein